MNDVLKISFDNDKLSKWLIKIAFNHERVVKGDASWFEKNIDYIMGKSSVNGNFSVFAGLYSDIVPFGEENGLYLPLNIGSDLKFFDNGFMFDDGPIIIKKIYKSYSFRFANVKFLLILWDDDIKKDELSCSEELINILFPYKNINNENLTLERVNDAFTYMFSNFVIGYPGLAMMDDLLNSTVPDLEYVQNTYRESFKNLDKEFTEHIQELSIESYNMNANK